MSKHVRILAWLQITFGLLIGILAMGVLQMASFRKPDVTGWELAAVLAIAAASTAIPVGTGIALFTFRPGARIAGIALSVVELLKFPIGTSLGLYGLWVLLSADGAALFRLNQLSSD